MSRLSKEELINTEGGAFKISGSILAIISGVVTFGIGFVNGILRPLGCSNSK